MHYPLPRCLLDEAYLVIHRRHEHKMAVTANHRLSNASDNPMIFKRARSVLSLILYSRAHSRNVFRSPRSSSPHLPQELVCPLRRWASLAVLSLPQEQRHKKRRLLCAPGSTSRITSKLPYSSPGVTWVRCVIATLFLHALTPTLASGDLFPQTLTPTLASCDIPSSYKHGPPHASLFRTPVQTFVTGSLREPGHPVG